MIFISNLKEKGSNLPLSVHNVLIWLVCLFSRSFAKEMRNSPIPIRNEAFGGAFRDGTEVRQAPGAKGS